MKQYLFQSACALTMVSASLVAKPANTNKQEQTKLNFQKFTGKVLGQKVRMRLDPNLEGHIVKELSKGDIFAVVAEKEGYYGVAPTENMKAYIYRTYVLDNKVDAEHVNVRLEPSTDAPIIAQLNSGDPVDVHVSPKNSKWYEINLPNDVVFWVAQEYVEKIGPVEYAQKYHERHQEAKQLLETAMLIKQTEFRKNFMEVDFQRLTQNFMRVKKDFPEMADIQEKAEQAITDLQKEYCDLKIAFLENQAGQAAIDLQTLNAQLASKETHSISAIEEEQEASMPSNELSMQNLVLNFPENVTDKMKIWQPLEVSEFQLWASSHPEATLENFYGEQAVNASEIVGIIEPFNSLLKHKPGDYVLVRNGQTVAYLYSTHVNLQDMIGKKVSLKVTERDSRNFAFPAFYVLEVNN